MNKSKLVIALMLFVAMFTTANVNAQSKKTETIKVSGNCGMCKKTIEKAAKTEGVESADWNKETKMMTVTFDASKISLEQINKNVANAGYDNEDFKGDDKAYENLPPCCQYDRESNTEKPKVAVWQPIEDIHMMMMNIMQPMMMKDDLKPARENASKLLEKVKMMATATDRPATISETQMNEIVSKAGTYSKIVTNNGTDKKVKKSLMKFRIVFKEIVPEKMQSEHKKMHEGMMKGGMKGKMHKRMMGN